MKNRNMTKIATALLVFFALASNSWAQNILGNEFITQTPGKNVQGFILMCLNTSNQAVPATSAGQCLGSGGGASVTQGTTPWVDNITQWGSSPVVNGGVAGLVGVGGNVASGATDSGNGVKGAGVVNTALPTFTAGQRADFQMGNHGALTTQLAGANSNSLVGAIGTGSDGITAFTALGVGAAGLAFNGTAFDRQFTCPLSAAVSVTNGTTAQIIGLSGSTIIRVCSFVLTSSAASSAQFISGTGTNCGTGAANLTGVMNLAAATPLSLSAGGNSLLRGPASAELCLAAGATAITGFVNYAQY